VEWRFEGKSARWPASQHYISTMDLRAKLQLKPQQHVKTVQAPNSDLPNSLETESVGDDQPVPALLVFVTDRSALEAHREQIVEAASRDHLTWVAYPKSGQLGTDLKRDALVALLMDSGIQPVRQVAIDEAWSALRFRPG
jgi:hypothetical protein